MSAHLRITSGPEQGRTAALSSGMLVKVGRADTCDIVLNDPYVSRVHCTLLMVGTQAILANQSTKGTFLNGQKIGKEERVRGGDVVRVGTTELVFETATPAPMAPPPTQQTNPATVEQLAEFVGQQMGFYVLEEVLGQGATGVVFKVRDTRDGMVQALKVFVPAFAANTEHQQRFLRMLSTVRSLKHPNLIRVYEAGEEGPYCWLAMEYVEGESLAQILARLGESDLLEWADAYQVAVQVAQALVYAHGEGVVHRNITPANILVRTKDKHVFLGDLMLAKALAGAGAKQVTRIGETLGDLSYLPPERIRQSETPDPRSDLYGLGATLFHLLTGRPPFVAKGIPQLLEMIANTPPPPLRLSQTSIPGWFETLVLRLLAKEPQDRPASAADLLAELERGKAIVEPPPFAAPPRRSLVQTTKLKPLGQYAFLAAPQTPGELGRLGHFRVLRQLGEGGMGMVFLAEDSKLQRPVALKVMRPDIVSIPGTKDRFMQEAKLMASLRSDHIVTIYQVDEEGNTPFMAMELLEGMPLESWLERGKRMTVRQIVRIGQEVAWGLAAAHSRGVIHRDIKPANLWLEAPRGRVKILDFGLALAMQRDKALTQEGVAVGTPYYMSPEQAKCEKLDHRSDLFSLGCVLYELCSGSLPFEGDSPFQVIEAIVSDTPTPLDILNPELPPELGMLVSRLLAKKREQRPPHAEALATAFETLKTKVA